MDEKLYSRVVVNGMSARKLASVIKRCVEMDACGECPYRKQGSDCVNVLMLDAAIAIRRIQKTHEKYVERSRKK